MENLNELKKMLENFEEKGRFYWINALLKHGIINTEQAGWLCIELNALK